MASSSDPGNSAVSGTGTERRGLTLDQRRQAGLAPTKEDLDFLHANAGKAGALEVRNAHWVIDELARVRRVIDDHAIK